MVIVRGNSMVCAVALVTPVSTAETAKAKVIWFEVSLEPVEPLLDGGPDWCHLANIIQ